MADARRKWDNYYFKIVLKSRLGLNFFSYIRFNCFIIPKRYNIKIKINLKIKIAIKFL